MTDINGKFPLLIEDRYLFDHRIARGKEEVTVYKGTDLWTSEGVAVKLALFTMAAELRREVGICQIMSKVDGFPEYFWQGDVTDYTVLIQTLLGPDLKSLMTFNQGPMGLETVCLLADQAIHRIQDLHKKRIIHRDIKPQNFAMGTGKRGNTLFLIDFGLSITDTEPGSFLANPDGVDYFAGTAWYASRNIHRGRGATYKDDLESLGYSLLELLGHRVPWQDVSALEDVRPLKLAVTWQELCGHSNLPIEFRRYFEELDRGHPAAKPNYAKLRRLLRAVYYREKTGPPYVFDWTRKAHRMLVLQETGGSP